MKRTCFFAAFALAAILLASSVQALEYTVESPEFPYNSPTSVEEFSASVPNADRSKIAAFLPPSFGSATSYAPNMAEYLTPNLAPESRAEIGTQIGGENTIPPSVLSEKSVAPKGSQTVQSRTVESLADFLRTDGSVASLSIPAIGVSVKVYEGTDSATLAKGAGHFEDTPFWNGNVAVAGHNRGVNCYFGNLYKLKAGDEIQYTTLLGTRTYAVASVEKISETDRSGLAQTAENRLTLYSCVRDEKAYRWRVTAYEK